MQEKEGWAAAGALSGVTLGALVILTVGVVQRHGHSYFFREGDASLFRAAAWSPFGDGKSFAAVGRLTDAPYRYGRIGLPLLGWLGGLGHHGATDWALIVVHLLAISAVPGLAALLLNSYGFPAMGGAAVLAVPGLLYIHDIVSADPLMVALVLLAYVLDRRGKRTPALVALAGAILVKEVAIAAAVPWLYRAFRDRDPQRLVRVLATLVPYGVWCLWIRVRMGAFPFLARSISRKEALGLPGAGIHAAIVHHTPNYVTNVVSVVATVVVGLVGAWFARRWFPVAGATFLFALMTLCLGPLALVFMEELWRVLIGPQVFAVLCVVAAVSRAHTGGDAGGAEGTVVQRDRALSG